MKPSFQPFKVSFRHNPPPIRRIPLFKLGKRLSRASWTHGHKEPWSRPSSWVTWILEDLGPEDREELQNVLHLGGKMKTHAGCVCVHAGYDPYLSGKLQVQGLLKDFPFSEDVPSLDHASDSLSILSRFLPRSP